ARTASRRARGSVGPRRGAGDRGCGNREREQAEADSRRRGQGGQEERPSQRETRGFPAPERHAVRPFAFAALIGLTAASGCGASTMRVTSLDQLERVRASDAVKASSVQAPAGFARAERERELAREAHAEGDDVAANLHAELAIAAYGHAGAVTRLASAIANLA